MTKCWKCENEVTYLIRHRRRKKIDVYTIGTDGKPCNDRMYEYTSQSFKCPKCHRVLFFKEGPAKKFLIEKTTSKW